MGKTSCNLQSLPLGNISLFPTFVPRDLGQVGPGPSNIYLTVVGILHKDLDHQKSAEDFVLFSSEGRCSSFESLSSLWGHCCLSRGSPLLPALPTPILCLNRSILPPPSLKVSKIPTSPLSVIWWCPHLLLPLPHSLLSPGSCCLGAFVCAVPPTRRLRPGSSHRGCLLLHWASAHTSPPQRPLLTSNWA